MSKVRILKTAAGLAILAALILLVDVEKLWSALSNLTFAAFAELMALSAALIFVSAFKWKLFLDRFAAEVSILKLFGLYLVGYFVNTFLPSYLGGDVVRSWYVGKKIGQHQALAATILERFTGLVAMVSLALIFMWFVAEVTWQIEVAVGAVALGLAVLTITASSEKLLAQIGRIRSLHGVTGHLKKIQSGFQFAGGDRSLWVKSLALSYLYHTLTVVNTIIAAHAVGWSDPPLWGLFVVLPLILLVGSLPVAPSGLGIQEGAFYFFLHALGATQAQALGVALLLRAKAYLLALFGGVVWLRLRKTRDVSVAPGSSNEPLVDAPPPPMV